MELQNVIVEERIMGECRVVRRADTGGIRLHIKSKLIN